MIADEANYFFIRVKEIMLCCWRERGIKWLISTDFQVGPKFENRGPQS